MGLEFVPPVPRQNVDPTSHKSSKFAAKNLKNELKIKVTKVTSHIINKIDYSAKTIAKKITKLRFIKQIQYIIKEIWRRFKSAYLSNLYKINSMKTGSLDEGLRISHRKLALEELNTKTPDELDKNWNLNEYFGHTYIINLDKDKHRLEKISNNLKELGVPKFERFAATYGKELPPEMWDRMYDNSFFESGEKLTNIHKGQVGCFMSHYRVIKDAKEKHDLALKNYEIAKKSFDIATPDQKPAAILHMENMAKQVKEYSSILIFEDDNGFGQVINEGMATTSRDAGKILREAMRDLPEDWDMLYFMASTYGGFCFTSRCVPPEQAYERLAKLGWGVNLNAYAINSKMYNSLLEQLSKIEDPDATLEAVDHEIASLHAHTNSYVITPPICFQGAGSSSITNDDKAIYWNGLTQELKFLTPSELKNQYFGLTEILIFHFLFFKL